MKDETLHSPVELGAEMDYAEHERTFKMFITICKYALLVSAAVLIAMAFGFFTTAGFFSSSILFVLICALGVWLLR